MCSHKSGSVGRVSGQPEALTRRDRRRHRRRHRPPRSYRLRSRSISASRRRPIRCLGRSRPRQAKAAGRGHRVPKPLGETAPSRSTSDPGGLFFWTGRRRGTRRSCGASKCRPAGTRSRIRPSVVKSRSCSSRLGSARRCGLNCGSESRLRGPDLPRRPGRSEPGAG